MSTEKAIGRIREILSYTDRHDRTWTMNPGSSKPLGTNEKGQTQVHGHFGEQAAEALTLLGQIEHELAKETAQ